MDGKKEFPKYLCLTLNKMILLWFLHGSNCGVGGVDMGQKKKALVKILTRVAQVTSINLVSVGKLMWVKKTMLFLFRSFPLHCNCSLYTFDPDTRLFVFFIFFIIQIVEDLKTYTDLNPTYYFLCIKLK